MANPTRFHLGWHLPCKCAWQVEVCALGDGMTLLPGLGNSSERRVMLATAGVSWDRRWLADVDAAFAPTGMVACRVQGGEEAVQCVKQGGLAAAVFWTERRWGDGLTLVRIVRSIDDELPCWLVGDDASRWALQEALSLRVTSVLARRIEVDQLTLMLQKRLLRGEENPGTGLGNYALS